MRLDDRTVAVLTCPAGRKDMLVFDGEQRGFGVQVDANGRRSFLFQYNAPGGKRRIPLGVFGEVTTSQARKLAQKHRGVVAGGGDPWADTRASSAAAATAAAAAKQAKAAALFTVDKLVADWERIHLSHKRAPYRAEATTRLRKNLGPLLPLSADSIKRSQAARAVDDAAKTAGSVSVRRIHAYARAMFGWAQKRGMVEANPFQGIPSPGQETPRERVLTADELGLIWRAAQAMTYPASHLVLLLMLTLARRDEVVGMTWGELSPDLTLWTQPGSRTKNGKAHVVQLAQPAQEILHSLSRGDPDQFVLTTFDEKRLTAFSFIKRQLVKSIEGARAKVAKEAGLEVPPPLPDWRMHGFRRAGVTWLAENGAAPHIADRLLNHIQGSIQGVAAVYQRGQFMDERKRALEAWAAHLVACGTGQPAADNVVHLAVTQR